MVDQARVILRQQLQSTRGLCIMIQKKGIDTDNRRVSIEAKLVRRQSLASPAERRHVDLGRADFEVLESNAVRLGDLDRVGVELLDVTGGKEGRSHTQAQEYESCVRPAQHRQSIVAHGARMLGCARRTVCRARARVVERIQRTGCTPSTDAANQREEEERHMSV